MAACFECDAEAQHDHHVVPRSLGGTKTIALCGRCHGLVHSADLTSVSRLTKIALAAKRARGEYVGGRIRYGYRLADDGVMLVRDEAEQENIRAMIRCRQMGMSYRAASAHLAERGIVNRRGRPFGMQSMVNMVRREQEVSDAGE